MCGIAGVIGNRADVAQRATGGMVTVQHHRGPDDRGTVVVYDASGESVAFGATRLAIQDLSPLGHQPMRDDVSGNWIAYNGEVYNFTALRRELERMGERFRSGTDTEVLLRSYRVWGRDAFSRWHGMFACAIWDAARSEVVLVRDPLGIKPLYWARGTDGSLVFASELRALLASGLVPHDVDPTAVTSFLAMGSVRAPVTMFRAARSLAPGYFAVVGRHGKAPEFVRYWDLARVPVSAAEDANAVEKTRSELQVAVENNLVSDVPVAVFLSGGMDSSAIVAMAARFSARPVKTISVVFRQSSYDERRFSRLVANRWRTDHVEVDLNATDVPTLIGNALNALDQPSIDGINSFLVSRCAHEAGITVAMSGLGGDEVFGGYATFRRLSLLHKLRPWLRAASPVISPVLGLQQRLSQRFPLERLRGFAQGGDTLDAYLALRSLFTPIDVARLGGGRLSAAVDAFADDNDSLRRRISGLDVFHQVSLLEMELYMNNMLLRDADVMSMANSLEVRVPLLERRLVEWSWSLPASQKTRYAVPKGLLRQAVGNDVPAAALNRSKMGFSLPWPHLLRTVLRPVLDEVFSANVPIAEDFVDANECRRVWNEFREGGDPRAWSRVWGLFVLRWWLNRLSSAVQGGPAHLAGATSVGV